MESMYISKLVQTNVTFIEALNVVYLTYVKFLVTLQFLCQKRPAMRALVVSCQETKQEP
jgi:hypothetical protein